MDSPLGAVWPTAVSGSGALSGPSGTAARRRVPWSRAFLVRTRVDGSVVRFLSVFLAGFAGLPLDVHKAQVTACAWVPGTDGVRAQDVKQFKTTVGGLLVLADWLKAHGVTHVVMEATGDFWKPVWHIWRAISS